MIEIRKVIYLATKSTKLDLSKMGLVCAHTPSHAHKRTYICTHSYKMELVCAHTHSHTHLHMTKSEVSRKTKVLNLIFRRWGWYV